MKTSKENPMAGDVDLTKQFYSVGFLCQMLQQSPTYIGALMQSAGVEFDHWQNGVGQIRGDGVVKMKEKLAEVVADAKAQREAAQFN